MNEFIEILKNVRIMPADKLAELVTNGADRTFRPRHDFSPRTIPSISGWAVDDLLDKVEVFDYYDLTDSIDEEPVQVIELLTNEAATFRRILADPYMADRLADIEKADLVSLADLLGEYLVLEFVKAYEGWDLDAAIQDVMAAVRAPGLSDRADVE